MGDSETGQISADAAKIYENVYLPALFQDWCPLAIQAANVKAGDSVVDIACGTGVLAIAVSEHVGPEGKTIGVDINEGMLDIARSKSSSVAWLNAPAEELPFADDHFDCVVSQFGLMYFEDKEAAIREMMRVLQPGGTVAVIVWDKLDNNPGFAAEEHLWQNVLGSDEGEEAAYKINDKDILENLFRASGIDNIQVDTHEGTARFDSIESWIHTGAKGWTEDNKMSDDELRLLLDTAEKELTDFRTPQGAVAFPTSAHIATAKK